MSGYFKEAYALPEQIIAKSLDNISKAKVFEQSKCTSIKNALSPNEEVYRIQGLNIDDFLGYIDSELSEKYDVVVSEFNEYFYASNMEEWIRERLDRSKNTFPEYSGNTEDFGLDVESSKGTITNMLATISYCICDSTKQEIDKYIPVNYKGKFKEKVESNTAICGRLKLKDIVEFGIELPNEYESKEVRYVVTTRVIKLVYEVEGKVVFNYKPEINGKRQLTENIEQKMRFQILKTITKIRG